MYHFELLSPPEPCSPAPDDGPDDPVRCVGTALPRCLLAVVPPAVDERPDEPPDDLVAGKFDGELAGFDEDPPAALTATGRAASARFFVTGFEADFFVAGRRDVDGTISP